MKYYIETVMKTQSDRVRRQVDEVQGELRNQVSEVRSELQNSVD